MYLYFTKTFRLITPCLIYCRSKSFGNRHPSSQAWRKPALGTPFGKSNIWPSRVDDPRGPRPGRSLARENPAGSTEGSSRGDIAGSFARARAARACGRAPGMGQTFREVSKLTPAALWSSTELSMVGVETSTGVGHPKKLVQRASRGLGKTFFTRKKPVKYAMDGLLVRLGPLQTFCRGSGLCGGSGL